MINIKLRALRQVPVRQKQIALVMTQLNQKKRGFLGLINNFLIFLGWVIGFLKLMIIYWYVSAPAILILISAIYYEHKRKHRSDVA